MKKFGNRLKQIILILVLFISGTSCSQTGHMKKVIYVMDPQCGWCFGNSKNITELYGELKGDLEFEFLVGGMWLGERAPTGGAALAQFIQSHAPRMVQVTGAAVGTGYYERTQDSSYTFSSLEPSAAIVWAKAAAPDRVFEFAKAVQSALFVSGKRLDELETYLPLLEAFQLDQQAFIQQWMSAENIQATQLEFERAGQLANGFPALLFQEGQQIQVIRSGYFDKTEVIQMIKQRR